MSVTLAKTAGFCYGVKRAVELAEQTAQSGRPCVMLGSIIHNEHVVAHLKEQGMGQVMKIEDVPEGSAVLIRSHGEAKEVYDRLEAAGIPIIDATCPSVARIHKLVQKAEENGRQPVIIGLTTHPEVVAIAGWCRSPVVLKDAEALKQWLEEDENRQNLPLTFVFQTTSTRSVWKNCENIAKKQCTNAEIFDTICNATAQRQLEAQELAARSDVMIVIGDHQSSNTRHLTELCQQQCSQVCWIEQADELSADRFAGASCVGITAGASTPGWIIKEVKTKMSNEVKMEIEESFAELLEASIKTLNTGDKVIGTVVQITPTDIQVDLGTKHAGYIAMNEFSDDPAVKAEEILKPGEGGVVANYKGIRVFIPASQTGLRRNEPMTGLVGTTARLHITEVNRSRRRVVGSIRSVSSEERAAKSKAVWDSIEVGKHYSGTVKSLTSYGAFVDIGGVDGMVHISELSWSRIKHPSEVVSVGDPVDVYVIKYDPEKKKISLGMKDPGENPWETFLNKYSVGDTATVKVVKLMTFGAFAEVVPGVDGLIHISQIADHRVEKPEDELKEGDIVDVKITDINLETKKVSLSRRAVLQGAPVAEDEE